MLGRVIRGTLLVPVGLSLLAGLAIGLFYLRLSAGPLSFEGLPNRVASALAARIGPGWRVAIKDAAIELENGSLAVRALDLDVRNPEGASALRAPFAIVSVDTLSLLAASLQPRSIEFRDLQLRVQINRDGSLSFASAGEPAENPPAPADAPPPPPPAPGSTPKPSPVSAALASLFDLVLEPGGLVGVLDRARVANARLTIIDSEQRERAVFSQVEATFDRAGDRVRRFDMKLKGPRGEWRLGGDLHSLEAHRREGVITATQVPVQDLLLLSGLSNVPGTTDLKLSVRAEAALVQGLVSRFDAHVETGGGVVHVQDKDTPPILVDAALADASWDEARGALALKSLTYRGGDTNVRLQGEFLAAKADQGWRLALSGRDAVVSGAAPGDRPFTIEDIQADVAGRDEGVVVDRLALRGPMLAAELAGSVRTLADQGGLRVNIRAWGTAARTALRLWPDAVTPNVRQYLVENLRGGTADALAASVSLSARDLTKATTGGPIPDEAVKIDFAVKDGEITVANGLPPLSHADVSGTVTGTKAMIRASRGRAEMSDGRALSLSDGSFSVPEMWADVSMAKVAFRLEGGADGLASFLRTPLIRTVSGFDLDPAAVSGRTDLRVAIPLVLKNMPKFADLPISVSGTIADLSIEKGFGKEKLEGANLTAAYDKGNLTLRGEGKVVGTPVTIDVRQPRAGAGEAVATLVLDEAARARKGLAFGSQVTGPIPVRVTAPLGKVPKGGPRVEADLTKAGIDDVIPGWTKPAGKPGRLSFVVADDKGIELRDLSLDSGPVQLRGTAYLTPDGGLDKLELATVKLSGGDDLRAVVEKAGSAYRVLVRGNVADARPFAKGLSSPGTPASAKGHATANRESRDVDLDLAVNILTGFNDEALTNASLKASIKNRDLRQLQLNGRLRTAAVTGRMIPQQGASVLALQSQDAGAMLRFLDIYRRMIGGDLALQAAMGEGVQTGSLSVHGFTLRDEPALRRIIGQQPPSLANDGSGAGQASRFNVSDVQFNRARVDFSRTASRLEFRDAVISGAQIGFTVNGWIDYARDQTDIKGTFVPAYGLNNVFAQVPLFGPILGGGRNEGLFAVNFRISGAASSPTLTVNPLSAIAPGFLRKLFGAGSADEDAMSPLPPYTER